MKNIFKIFSRTTGQEKLEFTGELSDIVQKAGLLKVRPSGSGWAKMGETNLYLFLYKKK
jgi:hypothetical protein